MRPVQKYIAILLAALIFGLATYAVIDGITLTVADTEPHYGRRVEVVLKARANPPDFWRIVEQGIRMAAAEYALEYNVTGPTHEIDIDRQIELVEQAIARQPDALILAACDYERLAPLVKTATKAGIKVIMVDSDADAPEKSSLVCTDNYALGQKLASLMGAEIGPQDRFGVVGHVQSTTTATERRDGLLNTVADSEHRLAAITYCDGSSETAAQQTKDMLAQYPEIKCMVGLNESSALGIAEALDELGLAGKVKLIACDSSQAMIQRMEDGTIQAFVVQNPFNMGYLSMQTAANVLDGKKVEPVIHTESIIITKQDMYRPENQKLLFPFTE